MYSRRALRTPMLALAVVTGTTLLGAPLAQAATGVLHSQAHAVLKAAPADSTDSSTYSLADTFQIGQNSRQVAVDPVHDRGYVTINRSGGTGALTWVDLKTGKPSGETIELGTAEPYSVVVSKDGNTVYVLHYGNSILSVVDVNTGKVTSTIPGMPKYPSGLIQDTDSGLLYAFDSDGLTEINPVTGTVGAPIKVSKEAYPLVKDVVYDSTNHMIWIAEGRAKVITGYSTLGKAWMDSIKIPVSAFSFPNGPAGGRASNLAIDPELGHLYVALNSVLGETWKKNKIVTIDTKSGKLLGQPVEVGENVYKLAVNPVTHEVYSTDGYSNTVSVISPATWAVSNTIDFNALGVTNGTGAGNADLWGLGVNPNGGQVYVTHPYGYGGKGTRMSVINRAGATPTISSMAVAPGQDDGTVPTTPAKDAWSGPAAGSAAEAPSDAVTVDNAAFGWGVSDYMKAWTTEPLGSVDKDDDQIFHFTSGKGWVDPKTHAASISWGDGFRIRHYVGLAPDVITTMGNPILTVDAAGKGTLTMDVAWSVSKTGTSNGFKRVTLATFANAKVTVTPAKGTTPVGKAAAFVAEAGADQASATQNVTITATPDFKGRPYTDGGVTRPDSFPADFIDYMDPQMRAWWFTSGASMDSKKVPLPISASFAAELPVETTPTETPTTSAPSTSAPSTSAPSTDSPTTGSPSTGEPTTSAPSTGTPTSGVPSTGTPTGAPTGSASTNPTNLGVTTGASTGSAAAGDGELASTGANLALPLGLAGVTILAGGGITIAAARKRRAH